MCEYIQDGGEIAESFERWILRETSKGDGSISAETIAEAWNLLCIKNEWEDYLKVTEQRPRGILSKHKSWEASRD